MTAALSDCSSSSSSSRVTALGIVGDGVGMSSLRVRVSAAVAARNRATAELVVRKH